MHLLRRGVSHALRTPLPRGWVFVSQEDVGDDLIARTVGQLLDRPVFVHRADVSVRLPGYVSGQLRVLAVEAAEASSHR